MIGRGGDVAIAAILDEYDGLVGQFERYLQELEDESGAAEASGDPRYIRRIDRSVAWCREALDTLDSQILNLIADLRHTAAQLESAREGKIV